MVDQFLTAKVVVSFKAQIQTNGDLWKDDVQVRLTLGRRAETRTVQGGGIDALPAEIISAGEFEVPLTTDVVEVPSTPINPDSLSFWIKEIFDGIFPVITILYQAENQAGETVTLSFDSFVTEVTPMEKLQPAAGATQQCIVRFIPKDYTSFRRV